MKSLHVDSVSGRPQRMRMGASLTKKKRERKWNWSGPAGEHSPFPLDPVPYPGPDLLYCFVDITASYRFMRNQVNLGPQVVTTDIDDHIDDILDCYEEGFYLNEFVKIPVVKSTTEIQDWSETHPYQAILSKPTVRPIGSEEEHWGLKVEKRILSTRTLAFDDADSDNDLLSTINEYAKIGARLVCAEPVGYVRSKSTNTQYSVMGVELFFNIPKHKQPTRHTYHAVKVPANYHIVPDATQTIQQVMCDADFMGQLSLFLNKGWKLVDICIDTTAIAEAYKMRQTSRTVDTIWLFEKEDSKLLDESPQYEGVIIEYLHKVKVGIDGEYPCKDWRPVVAGMGVSGWELAAIIQTPLLIQSTFTTYTMKLLMIFQRKILQSFETMKRLKASSSLPNTPDRGQFFKTLMHSEGQGGSSGRHTRTTRRGSDSAGWHGDQNHVPNYHRMASDGRTTLDNLMNGHIIHNEKTLGHLGKLRNHGNGKPPSYWEATHTPTGIPVS